MKIGILSDTHDNVPKIQEAIAYCKRAQVEMILHGGDFIAPFALNPLEGLSCPIVGVWGNNDGERLGLMKRSTTLGMQIQLPPYPLEAGGRKILLMHEPHLLDPLSQAGSFDLLIYGHTHHLDVRRIGNTLILNPGEVGGWLTGKSTMAIVDLMTMQEEVITLP
jgi:hypothetical protein